MKTANTVFGQSAGKLAGVVASRWKGINVVREKPLTVNQPNSVPQLNQRARMALAVLLAKVNLPSLQTSYKEMAIHQSAYNEGVRQLLKGITATAGVASFATPVNVAYAKGSLANVQAPVLGTPSGTDVEITFTDNSNGSNILGTDNVWAVAVKGSTKEVYYVNTGASRADATAECTFPVNIATGFSFFMFTTRPTEGKASDSVHVI